MFWNRPNTIIFAGLLVLLLSVSEHTLAQESYQYKGAYQVGAYEGEASFFFIMEEKDTVLNGFFNLQHADPKSLITQEDNYFSFKGSFDHNIPTGNWEFNFGKYHAADNHFAEVSDYQFHVNVSGIHQQATGSLSKGKPNGQWIQSIYKVENAKRTETLFKSTLHFEEGIPQRNFQIQNEDMTLAGRFLREGLAHDNWELYSMETPDAAETWQFNEGRLVQIIKEQEGRNQIVEVYPRTLPNEKVISLDKKYLAIIRLTQQLAADTSQRIEGNVNALLAQNASQYQKIDTIFHAFDSVQFMPVFKVKVAYHPLSKQEIQQLDSVQRFYEIAHKRSKALVKNTQLNLLKFTDPNVLFQLATVEQLQQSHLSFLREMLAYWKQGVLDYIPHEDMVKKLWPAKQSIKPVTVQYEEEDSLITKTFNGPALVNQNTDATGIAALYQLAAYTYWSIDLLKKELEEKLQQEKVQQELMELEEQLIAASMQLNQHIDSLQADTKGATEKGLKSIKATAKKVLSDYSAMDDISLKPDRAAELITCFTEMEKLSSQVAQLPVQQEELQTLYTDDVWNPFTSTVMSEQVKKHIMEAYEEDLIPYVYNNINDQLSCEQVTTLTTLLVNLYDRMVALRKEETDKLERKIRKEDEPQELLRLLNVNTNPKSIEQ